MKVLNEAPKLVLVLDRPRFPESMWSFLPELGDVADAVLVRDQEGSPRDLIRLAERVRTLAPQLPLWIHGRLEVALALDAEGLHLPANHLPADRMRAWWPGRLSASAHDGGEAWVHRGADVLIWGHTFVTRSKPGLTPRRTTALNEVQRVASCPILAIGGINSGNVARLAGWGLTGVAVADGIWCTANPAEAARHIRATIRNVGWQ